ncbi:hypothetical protein DXG03_008131, partial [Asterophora parasitica]
MGKFLETPARPLKAEVEAVEEKFSGILLSSAAPASSIVVDDQPVSEPAPGVIISIEPSTAPEVVNVDGIQTAIEVDAVQDLVPSDLPNSTG